MHCANYMIYKLTQMKMKTKIANGRDFSLNFPLGAHFDLKRTYICIYRNTKHLHKIRSFINAFTKRFCNSVLDVMQQHKRQQHAHTHTEREKEKTTQIKTNKLNVHLMLRIDVAFENCTVVYIIIIRCLFVHSTI